MQTLKYTDDLRIGMPPITKEAIARDLKLDITRRAKLKTVAQWNNEVNKIHKNYMDIYETPLVKDMTVTLSWKNSKSHGKIPHALVIINYTNGTFKAFIQKLSRPDLAYNKTLSLLQLVLNNYAQQNILHKRLSPNKNYSGIVGHRFADKLPTYYLHKEEGKFYNFTIKKTPTQNEYIIKFN